jgi:hypothetical protein
MTIVDLAAESEDVREQAAALLVDGFKEPGGWPTLDLGREEVARIVAEGFARAARR